MQKNKYFNFKIANNLLIMLKKEAAEKEISIAALLNSMIEKYFDKLKKKKEKELTDRNTNV